MSRGDVPEVSNSWGGTWLEDGTILYTNFLATGEAIFAVDADGGEPAVVKGMEKLNEDYSFPFPLPDGSLLTKKSQRFLLGGNGLRTCPISPGVPTYGSELVWRATKPSSYHEMADPLLSGHRTEGLCISRRGTV